MEVFGLVKKNLQVGAFTIWYNPWVVLLILSFSLLISVLSVQRARFVLLACMCRGMPLVSLCALRLHLSYRNKWYGCFHFSLFSPCIAQFPSCFYLHCLKVVSLSWLLESRFSGLVLRLTWQAKLTSSTVSWLSSFLWPWYFSERCEPFRIHWTFLVLYHLSARQGIQRCFWFDLQTIIHFLWMLSAVLMNGVPVWEPGGWSNMFSPTAGIAGMRAV